MKKLWMLLTALFAAVLLTMAPAQADVLLPSGVTEIEDSAFEFDTALTGQLVIPEGTTRIGDYAFGYCTGLTSVTIPDTVTEIGEYAFYGCSGLESVTLPSAMQKIGAYAFYGCTGLKTVKLPATIASIGDAAFYECDAITGDVCMIDTPDANKIFWYCPEATVYNFTIREDGSLMLDGYFGKSEQANVPASAHGRRVTALDVNVFNNQTELTSIILPDTLVDIGRGAFAFCTGLTSMTIPSSVKEIGETAFYGCTGLKSVTLQEGLTAIGPYAFAACTGLTGIVCPDSLTVIRDGAFSNCTALKDLTLSENTHVESFALKNTAWLTAQAQAVADAVTHAGQSDFEKALALHDWITANSEYDLTFTYYAAENLFLYHTGVCQAYMEAYTLMLTAVGIESKEVTGTANGGLHGWNLVKLDGEWYHVDCTWDDPLPDGNENHEYFCVPDAVMQEDHIWNAADYPAATGTKYFRGQKAD